MADDWLQTAVNMVGGVAAAAVAFLYKENKATSKDLADFKVTVAKEYATTVAVREVKEELVGHLLRIEEKLDRRPPGSRRATD